MSCGPFPSNFFRNDLLLGYTTRSWWQVYNDDENVSSAFRETNYEPEVFLRHYGGPEFLGGRIAGFDIGLNHQSNGRGEAQSGHRTGTPFRSCCARVRKKPPMSWHQAQKV